ncbi:putative hydrolase or acyltransferase of alpha/beta superfamily [Thermoanaerobacter siderophilus SR4]|uniref:Putative hydrolase or acyltransferase of alpha/beta superfamily n=1 Tax=Thermoanaerobacter siderophilus SR4 TaxID=880478 RepID=I8R732_9THEO|nr:alpha/beta hydrolase [Thermoanaerobacter siderophilus]EIW01410.1 putative hydrolase or acyltransferase of alpha/beta superfamily [Thermoanaerobacter siderophilus SR4]
MVIKNEYVDIKGNKIHYLEVGEGNNNDIVMLLHGKRYNAYDWINSGIAENLSNEGFKVICFELPGYGSSQECDLEKEEALLEFVKNLNIPSLHLVAPSFSGEISIKFALKYGNMLKSLTIVDSINIDKYKEKLNEIYVKTLIVWGKKDEIAPYEFAEILKNNIKNSALFVFENLGHTCYFDDAKKIL